MNNTVKMLIGLLILITGIWWYAAPLLGLGGNPIFPDILPTKAFATIFSGMFGLVLIFLGLLIAWLEYEDMKWKRKKSE
jgi:threonine/homoserine/homoserine lactone efflux protein